MNVLLRKIGEKISITKDKQDYIASKVKTERFAKNDFFIEPGQVCNRIGYVENGLMRVFNVNQFGEETTNWMMTDDELVTEVLSFLNQEPTQEHIQCIETTTISYVTYQDLQEIYTVVPEMYKYMKSVNEEVLISIKKYLLSNIHLSAEERYEQLLNVRPELVKRAPLKHIASFLGMTDSTLSRVRKKILVS